MVRVKDDEMVREMRERLGAAVRELVTPQDVSEIMAKAREQAQAGDADAAAFVRRYAAWAAQFTTLH